MAAAVLDEQADMVVGDRLSSTYFAENKRPFHNLGNGLVRASINHLFGSDIKDIMTGYRAFSYAFVKTYPVLSKGFEIETDMTIHAINRRMQGQQHSCFLSRQAGRKRIQAQHLSGRSEGAADHRAAL